MFHIGKYIGLVVLLSAFSGFPAQAQNLPPWGLESVSIGTQTVVFSGTGSSMEAARTNALASLMTHLSSDVQTKQSLTLQKENNQSTQNFSAHTTIETLALELPRLEVVQQFESEGVYAIQLSLARRDLEQALLNKIETQAQLTIPTEPRRAKVLWALQYSGLIEQALRYESVLASLNRPTTRLKESLQQQQLVATQTLQNAGIRMVLSHDLQYLSATLSRHFPGSSEELFWLKVDQRTFKARSTNGYHHRQVYNFSLVDSKLPFTPYLNQEVIIDGIGASPELAAQDSQQKTLNYIQQDLSTWFFK